MQHLHRYTDILEAATKTESLQKIEKEILNIGFSHMMFAALPTTASPLGSAFIYSNYDKGWRKRYDEEQLATIDPIVAHCFQRNVPLVWGLENFSGAPQQALYDEACSHGLVAGITLPGHGVCGATGMLTCVAANAAAAQRLGAAHLPDLVLLRDIAFDTLGRFGALGDTTEAPKLSVRERECLQWHAAGKTSWEIGRILNVTEACVNFHFTKIRNKFEVSHRHEAVIKALVMGVISMP